MACLELRACKVADCAGKRGDALKTCLIHCASGSMSRSGACKKMAGSSILYEVRNADCIGSLDDDTLPIFPY
jgi:hypothetical protein